MDEPLASEVQPYYARGGEARRLFKSHGPIELARTQEIILRHLPPPPATVLDVGGGPGIYACWLAAREYRVHLVDALPSHVEQARQASARQPEAPLASRRVGDSGRRTGPPTLLGIHPHLLAVARRPASEAG